MLIMKSIPAAYPCIMSLLLFSLTSCSTIKGYFPDKANEYQLTSELPPLKIPADIADKGLEKHPAGKPLVEETKAAATEDAEKEDSAASSTTVAADEEQEKTKPVQIDLVKFANGETRLHINKSVAMAWRMVGKALSHKAIEITARDQANAEFAVQYDPNETDFEDESFWDEIVFVFGKDHSQEKPYHLKLLAREKITELVVLDEHDKPLADGGGLSLLKLLATTLKANVAEE